MSDAVIQLKNNISGAIVQTIELSNGSTSLAWKVFQNAKCETQEVVNFMEMTAMTLIKKADLGLLDSFVVFCTKIAVGTGGAI